MDAQTQLVLDTLYDRKLSNAQGCFVSNQAGLLLLESGASMIPVIENVLREAVEPVLSSKQMNRRNDSRLVHLLGDYSSLAVKSAFPGLDYVLGAYLVIAAKSDFPRAVKFLLTLSDALLIEAITAIPVFFKRMDGGYNFGVSPEGEVSQFVLGLSSSERKGVGFAAAQVMELMSLTHSP